MGLRYWFRVVMMLIALAATIFVMRKMNQTPNMAPYSRVHMGKTPNGTEPTVINLCPTRVARIEMPAGVAVTQKAEGCADLVGKPKTESPLDSAQCTTSLGHQPSAAVPVTIFQKGMNWYRDPDQLLDQVAVEKWFSRHCNLNATKVPASADVKKALKVYFVSGETQDLLKSAGGEYEWMGQPFSSSQMDEALQELGNLPASN